MTPFGQSTFWQALRADLRIAGAGTGAALALALLVSFGQLERVPSHLPLALLALSVLTAWRPDVGLCFLAFAIPLASWAGRGWDYYVAWAEALVVAFAAGWFLRAVFLRTRDRDDLDPPLQIGAAVVAASLLVGVGVINWRLTGQFLTLDFVAMIGSDYFVVKSSADAFDAGMRLLEGLLLFRAASTCAAQRPSFTPRLARFFVGGAAIAGALNVWRLWLAAERAESPLAAFVRYLATVRENIHYGDLNAAGSFFVLALFATVGLARQRASRRAQRACDGAERGEGAPRATEPGCGAEPHQKKWWTASVVIAAALWVTGSRAALVAGLLAALVPLVRRAWLTRRRRTRLSIAAAGLILVASAAAAAHYLPQRGSQRPSLDALQVRWELVKTSLRMTAAHPFFGAGIGQFYHLSGTYSSSGLLSLFPPAQNENAHNNFLQVLAELGLVGFAVFLWLLGVTSRRIVASLGAEPDNRLRWSLAAGLLAFVLTWLGGHPLLVDEPAFSFWIVLGAVAGWTQVGNAGVLSGWAPSRAIVAAVVVALLVSIPARTRALLSRADMEHAGFGLSLWQPELDGVRFRLSAGHSTVFVPTDARSVSIPLRPVQSGRTLEVVLTLDGRPADTIRVPADKWYELRLLLPQSDRRGRFRRLDLDVSGVNRSGPDVLMIGKVESR